MWRLPLKENRYWCILCLLLLPLASILFLFQARYKAQINFNILFLLILLLRSLNCYKQQSFLVMLYVFDGYQSANKSNNGTCRLELNRVLKGNR